MVTVQVDRMFAEKPAACHATFAVEAEKADLAIEYLHPPRSFT